MYLCKNAGQSRQKQQKNMDSTAEYEGLSASFYIAYSPILGYIS